MSPVSLQASKLLSLTMSVNMHHHREDDKLANIVTNIGCTEVLS